MRYRLLIATSAAAFAALPATASASQMINRNATSVKLAVNRNGIALVTYRSAGRLNHTLAWGAINARTPTRGMKQVKFKFDYSGGWGSHGKNMWKGFRNACGPYEGPQLRYLVAACTAPGSEAFGCE